MSDSKINNDSLICSIVRWFDAYAIKDIDGDTNKMEIDWLRAAPFIALHFAVLFVFVVGWSPIAVAVAIILYAVRMFCLLYTSDAADE